MAQYRQSGMERTGIRGHGDFQNANGNAATSIRIPHKIGRIRRPGRSEKSRKISIGAFVVILSFVLFVTFFTFNYLFRDKEYHRFNEQGDNAKDEMDAFSNGSLSKASKVLKFGQGSVGIGRDSRFWDKDDRRRDDEGHDEDGAEHSNIDADPGSSIKNSFLAYEGRAQHVGNVQSTEDHIKSNRKRGDNDNHRGTGLYNEAGRDELKHYEKEYEASLKNGENSVEMASQRGKDSSHGRQSRRENDHKRVLADELDMGFHNEEVNADDEYDDGIGIDLQDAHNEDLETRNGGLDHQDDDISGGIIHSDSIKEAENTVEEDSSLISGKFGNVKTQPVRASVVEGESAKRTGSEKKSELRRKGKRRKFGSSSCEMRFLNSTAQLVEPLESKKFSRFSLRYVEVESRPSGKEEWEPRFAGHQSLQEREESFYARDQKINCGFIKGPKGSPSTGFDLAEDDVKFMSSCHIAVSSCIFGSSDNLRNPTSKTVTRLSRKNVCFVMFVDENTLQMLSSEGQKPDWMGHIGLWKIVVVKNLPYTDMRRVGKIPKFLTHRLFPSARYSIWLDSKLRLQSDPMLILEYFLWRRSYEYAISNHYDRHCVWEEVAQNKKLNKFNHTIIDQQFAFYQADRLKRFNASDPNKLLPSHVPEGSFIVRAHTPMSNLFSCLWFNEVDRFTPRDQLSFAYTYLKLRRMNPEKAFYLNMFKDCERRSMAKLFHHRSEEKRSIPLQAKG